MLLLKRLHIVLVLVYDCLQDGFTYNYSSNMTLPPSPALDIRAGIFEIHAIHRKSLKNKNNTIIYVYISYNNNNTQKQKDYF